MLKARIYWILMYTKDILAAILSNISTPLGIVNGAHRSGARSRWLVTHTALLNWQFGNWRWPPTAKHFPMDDLYVLCSPTEMHSIWAVIAKKKTIFPGMGSTAIPIFCLSTSVKIENISVIRHQVPMTPAWAITDYKVQGATYIVRLYHSRPTPTRQQQR
jgi:hypothetical protein